MLNNYVYCTAIIKLTGKESYETVFQKFKDFEKLTLQEKGCIAFSVCPMSQEKEEIALWEIWEDETTFYNHHNMEYTVALANQKLTEVRIFESSHVLNLS